LASTRDARLSNIFFKVNLRRLIGLLSDQHFTFLLGGASVDTSYLLNFTHWSPTGAGVALDVTGRWFVQLFIKNTGGLLLWTLESGKCDTSHVPIISRASPATTGNQEQQQPKRNEERLKNII
jgi:hypothetical protein